MYIFPPDYKPSNAEAIIGSIIGLVLISLLLFSLFSGCAERVIYKCPKGQVSILEDQGLETEAIRCYTPGTYYHDYRPISEKKIKGWEDKKENK